MRKILVMTPELDSKMPHAQVTLITPCEDLDTYEVLRAVVETCHCVKKKDVVALCPLCGPKYSS